MRSNRRICPGQTSDAISASSTRPFFSMPVKWAAKATP